MKKALSVLLALTMALSLASCGDDDGSKSSKKKDKEETGEYECTFVILNFYGSDAGEKSADVEARFQGTSLTISGEKLSMEGGEFTISPEKSDNLYYNYLVTVKESGYNVRANHSERKYAEKDFDGPAWFMYAAAGTDQGGSAPEKDTIELYYSPAGTEDWYYSLTYTRK